MPAYVYILTNQTHVSLYTGSTIDLARIDQHKSLAVPGFTSKYRVTKLVYVEPHETIEAARWREKQVKRWHRQWKEDLINSLNPEWQDLSTQWL